MTQRFFKVTKLRCYLCDIVTNGNFQCLEKLKIPKKNNQYLFLLLLRKILLRKLFLKNFTIKV
jgi:hypothetical protein